MADKVPLFKLKDPRNWSRINPFVWLFLGTVIVLAIGITYSKLRIIIIPSLLILIMYGVFLKQFLNPLFE